MIPIKEQELWDLIEKMNDEKYVKIYREILQKGQHLQTICNELKTEREEICADNKTSKI